MGAFSTIRRDHDRIRAMFDRLEDLGARSHGEKRAIFDGLAAELEAHRRIEEEVVYPAADAAGLRSVGGERDAHAIIGRLVSELSPLSAGDRRFDALFAVLRENVEHHIREEEEEILRALERVLAPERLEELGRALAGMQSESPKV